PLVNAWGFGFTNRMKLNSNKVDSLMQFVGYQNFNLIENKIIKQNPGSAIDFNAIAKGYAVDVVGRFIEGKGISQYLVDIGGEVFARKRKHDGQLWKIGIEKPADQADSQRDLKVILELENEAIATSGNYRRYYEEDGIRYSHTIDPSTGYPVNHSLLSASVLAADCMTADAYATAFMVMGIERAKAYVLSHPGMEAYFIYASKDGSLETWASEGFVKKIVEQFD
ncbi:MAG: FAD:protein FMN transferase, partial [Bacteroidales bacterium]|nr:FAD:protein FMN transferase [Bacteroidales bacterium]